MTRDACYERADKIAKQMMGYGNGYVWDAVLERVREASRIQYDFSRLPLGEDAIAAIIVSIATYGAVSKLR